MTILIKPIPIPSVTGSFGAQIDPLDRFAGRASSSSTRIKAHVDQLLPVEVPEDLLLAQIALERRKRGGFAASGWFAYLAHIHYVEIDEIARSC